jgi:hypothetical protein
MSTRQAPVEHARLRAAHVLEAVHHVARDEDDDAWPTLEVWSPTVNPSVPLRRATHSRGLSRPHSEM